MATKLNVPKVLRLLLSVLCLLQSAAPAGAFERILGHGGPVKDVALSPQGDLLASVSFDYSVVLWDTADFHEKYRLLGHNAPVVTAAFSLDGRFLATGGDDFLALIWDMNAIRSGADPTPIARFAHHGKIAHLTISPDSSKLATASWDGGLRIWSLETMRPMAELRGHIGPVQAAQFIKNGAQIVSAGRDGHIRLWNLPEGRYVRSLVKNGWGINAMHIDEDLRFIAFGGAQGAMKIISLDDHDIAVTLAEGREPVLAIKYHRATQKLVFGTASGRVVIADMVRSTVINDFRATNGPVWGLAFLSHAASLVVAGLDDYFIAIPLDTISPGDNPLGMSDTKQRRFHPNTKTMGNGARQFAKKCSVCHSLDPDYKRRAGPSLYNIFGRTAGTAQGYLYSDALKHSQLIWDEHSIAELFRAGPDIVTPGSKMPVQRIKRAEDRRDLVVFLKSATRR
jgi:cytochrome c